ncbi:MAG: amino acid adenylation domain-containing protein [Pseudomonadota bacterium]
MCGPIVVRGRATLPGVVASEAARRGDAPAVCGEDAELTYEALEGAVVRLARRLAAEGAGPGTVVGVMLPRGAGLVVGLLSVMRTGAAYLPLDPAHPRARQRTMMADAGAGLVLCCGAQDETQRLAETLGAAPVPLQEADGRAPWEAAGTGAMGNGAMGSPAQRAAHEASQAVGQPVPGAALPVIEAEAPAYVIFTSGSTGRPKGVAVSHGALWNLLQSMAQTPGMAAGESLLATTTVAFDIAALELFLPLVVGGRTVVCAADRASDAQALKGAIAATRPALMQATPSAWRALLYAGWRNEEGVRILCGGEALSGGLAQALCALGSPVFNLYGPTETTIWSTVGAVSAAPGKTLPAPTIGRPIANTRIHVLSEGLAGTGEGTGEGTDGVRRTLGPGETGEIAIAGAGVALGYVGRPDLTATAFVPDAFVPAQSRDAAAAGRLYLTGDLGRMRMDGTIEHLGRRDGQLKVRGHRVEPGEIEAALEDIDGIARAAVVVQGADEAAHLVAWCETGGDWPEGLDAGVLSARLGALLPGYMVPQIILPLAALPLTGSGKIDRAALGRRSPPVARAVAPIVARGEAAPAPVRSAMEGAADHANAADDANVAALEEMLAAIWRTVLPDEAADRVRETGFFELGGTSITAVLAAERIGASIGQPFKVTTLFGHPHIAALAAHLSRIGVRLSKDGAHTAAPAEPITAEPITAAAPVVSAKPAAASAASEAGDPDALAIIGIAVRVPGASDNHSFFEALCEGRDLGRLLGPDALAAAGVPARLIRDPGYIPMDRQLEDRTAFDAAFFNIAPRTAALMDPQARLLMEACWAALEDGGHTPQTLQRTAVLLSSARNGASGGPSTPVEPQPAAAARAGAQGTGADPGADPADDYVAWVLAQDGTAATSVSYRLGLTGPSLAVHTNCSSGLVGLHTAARLLAAGDADAALVGAATLLPGPPGYRHAPGLNFAADGRCKTFDARADGMVAGEGVAAILVRPLAAARAAGDPIHAVVRAVAINNDGNDKVGFYAPSVAGQAAVITRALADAAVHPDTIDLVEAHGTGTRLGDPIEIAALTEAWRGAGASTGPRAAIGSVKTNVGHLDTAAGLIGLIKVALALSAAKIPPSLHFTAPNPEIDFEASPLRVAERLEPWPCPLRADGTSRPRRAAVSAFGIGGTNAHAILEEAPPPPTDAAAVTDDGPHLFLLSAKTDAALKSAAHALAHHLKTQKPPLKDVAHTLRTARTHHKIRAAFTAKNNNDAIKTLGRVADVGTAFDGIFQHGDDEDGVVRDARAFLAGGDPARTQTGQRIHLPTYPFQRRVVKTGTDHAKWTGLHPLVHRNISDFRGTAFCSQFTGGEAVIADHVIGGRPILPAVAMLEMARAAGGLAAQDTVVALKNVVFVTPLAVDEPVAASVRLEERQDGAAFEIATGGPETAVVHAQGLVAFAAKADAHAVDLALLRANCVNAVLDSATCHERLSASGAIYGRAFRTLHTLAIGHDVALAELVDAPAGQDGFSGCTLHPGMMDGAVQAAFLALDAFAGRERVTGSPPFEVSSVEIFAPCPPKMLAVIRPSGAVGRLERANVDLVDADGRVAVRMIGLARVAATPRLALCRPVWRRAAPASTDRQPGVTILCGSLAAALTPHLPAAQRIDHRDVSDVLNDAIMALANIVRTPGEAPSQVQFVANADERGLAALAGLCASARLEYPTLGAQLVLAARGAAPATVSAALPAAAALATAHVMVAADGSLAEQTTEPLDADPAIPWREDGVYVVTGGSGRLAKIVATDILVRTERAKVVVLGRSVAPDRATIGGPSADDRLELRTANVAKTGALHSVIAAIHEAHGRIDGVLHLAGALSDRLLRSKTADEVRQVLEPKVAGTLRLDEATAHLDLDLFVLFSSVSALGSLGQSDYAVANGFLDDFALWRAGEVRAGRRSGRTVSIAWPLWREGGMRPDGALDAQADGIGNSEGLEALYRAIATQEPSVIVAPPVAAAARAPDPPAPREAPTTRCCDRDNRAAIYEAVLAEVCQLIGTDPEDVDPDEEFHTLGFDSISLTNLANRLNGAMGVSLTPATFFEFATLNAFVDHLATLTSVVSDNGPADGGDDDTEPAPADAPTEWGPAPAMPSSGRIDVAVIGMSGRFPAAPTLEAYWQNLLDGRDCIGEVPPERWDWREVYGDPDREPGKTDVKWGGFVDGVERFDPLFFGLSPREAECTDPQQRLLMTHVWQALEDASYARATLAGSDTGLFVGMGASDYGARVTAADGGIEGHTLLGILPSMAPARISHFMDWHGPSEFVDTACSSSLVAVHRAVRAIRAGDCAIALAAGVFVMLSPTSHIGYRKAGMLSADGRCKTFSERADGYGRGEGVGVVVLKALDKALDDGDAILGVISGTAVNHGGRSNSLTAPNGNAQTAVVQSALQDAGVTAEDVSAIEAHGTGTKIGDPVEVNALIKAFEPQDDGDPSAPPLARSCALGSVKTNIGHLEPAAGIAGLIKVLLALQHKMLVKTLHAEPLNPYLALDGSPFFLVDRPQPWDPAPRARGGRRIAGVSSFGFGGVNAHVVVSEAPPQQVGAAVDTDPQLIVLSARSEAQVRARARALLAALAEHGAPDVRSGDIADRIVGALAEVLDVRPQDVSLDEPLDGTGLDILGRAELGTKLGLDEFSVRRAVTGRALMEALAPGRDRGTNRAPALADIAYTLQVGREAMEVRVGFVANTLAELRDTLGRVAEDGLGAHGVRGGRAKGGAAAAQRASADDTDIADWVAVGALELLCDAWVHGGDLPFAALHNGRRRQRLRLPGYPFEERRCWIDPPAAPVAAREDRATRDREPAPPRAVLHASVWRESEDSRVDPPAGVVVALGIEAEDEAVLAATVPGVVFVDGSGTIEAIAARLGAMGPIDGIVWSAPVDDAKARASDVDAQTTGVVALFRLAKALCRTGDAMRPLDVTVVSQGALTRGDGLPVRPAHASVHGFMGALAKEYPFWRVRLVDSVPGERLPWRSILTRAVRQSGEPLLLRDGMFHVRRLIQAPVRAEATLMRSGGTYVVIGGAGGLGEVFTRHIAARYDAQAVWIGRRPVTPSIEARIKSVSAVGPAPTYISADAADPVALAAALGQAAAQHGAIHGIVHAALVLRNRSLAQMDEADLAAVLHSRVGVCASLAEAARPYDLDFLLFFSSLMALDPAAGQSNYAAGCAFQDSFAARLDAQGLTPVRVMNWGWWGSTGAVANDEVRTRMHAAGLRSIEPDEGMVALEMLMASPLTQLALVKRMDPPAGEERVVVRSPGRPPLPAALVAPQPASPLRLEGDNPAEAGAILRLAGDAIEAAGPNALARYQPWIEETKRRIEKQADRPTRTQAKQLIGEGMDPGADKTAALALLGHALDALEDVLTGRVNATAVLFPDGSDRLVEPVYRDNAIAQHFNGALADIVAAVARSSGSVGVRILEVGAGTGATTVAVLDALRQSGVRPAQYLFTDVSPKFLAPAADRFGAAPGFATARFDVSRPPRSQGIQEDAFDIVIATNVLHATPSIADSLTAIKHVLRRGGVLLLNELTEPSLFTHVTFGLLDGWWSARDTGLRVQGSPVLAPASWARVLSAQGFTDAAFPLAADHHLGVQLVVSQSDGVIVERVAEPSAQRAAVAEPLAAQPLQAPVAQTDGGDESAVREAIAEELTKLLKLRRDEINDDVPFADYGVDSIVNISFVKALTDRFGVKVDPNQLFELPTLARLSSHLAGQGARVAAMPASAPPAPATPIPQEAVDRERMDAPIAVIGMAAQVPGASDSTTFWDNLITGKQKVGALPDSRCEGRHRALWGGVLEHRAAFDPQFFKIAPRDAVSMSPHQRLVLTESWKALEDAAIDPSELSGQRVGCFVGAEPSGYVHRTFTGASDALIAARLSYLLNLKGPALVVNTGCSSSAAAIHLASEALRRGECDLALAGGVYASLDEAGLEGLSELGMLSPSGAVRTFDAGADGTVFSEAVGMVILKRHDDAVAAGDPIRGVIVASGLNHDGTSNGLTAPNGDAQEGLIRATHERFGVDPSIITLIEAHGTGTRLGDPVEANALARGLGKGSGPRLVASAKAHIGHTAAAAGVIGLIKTLLTMRHGEVPALPNFETLNPLIDFAGAAFVIPTAPTPWPARADASRLAAINSFGHSGTNVHLVVREASVGSSAGPDDVPGDARFIVPLSAANPERLRALAGRLAAFLRQDQAPLRDVVFTLQTGRTRLKERLCLFAASRAALCAQLDDVAKSVDPTPCLRGDGEASGAVDATSIATAKQWLSGEPVNWMSRYGAPCPRRCHLPPYPFLETPYWKPKTLAAGEATIHPLLHKNVSTVDGTRFRTVFRGDEPILKDHVVAGVATLPAAAYLEILREAVAQCAPDLGPTAQLRGIAFSAPLQVTDEVALEVKVMAEGPSRVRLECVSVQGLHCRAQADASETVQPAHHRIAPILARLRDTLDSDMVYRRLADRGLVYGPTHRGIEEVRFGPGEALATLRPAELDGCAMPPGLIDSAFQATAAVPGGHGSAAAVPFAVASVSIRGDAREARFAHVTSTANDSFDVILLGENGAPLVVFERLSFRPLPTEPQPDNEATLLFRPVWQPVSREAACEGLETRALVIGPPDGTAHETDHIDRIDLDPQTPIAARYRVAVDTVVAKARETLDRHPDGVLLQVVLSGPDAALLSGLSGLTRTLALEVPRLSTQLVVVSGVSAAHALREASARPGLCEVRVSPDAIEAIAYEEVRGATSPVPWREGGVYLLSGGLGGIGRQVAERISSAGCGATVILAGRSEPDAEAAAWLKAQTNVVYRRLDIANAAEVERCVAEINRTFGGLQGVMHLAGVLRDRAFRDKTAEDVAAVLAAKVDGALALHHATAGEDLDFFALFSAAAGVFGNPGQVDYAAANGFLDRFASWRNREVRRARACGHTVSIAWPLWAEGGMSVSRARAETMRQASGTRPMPTTEGLDALERALTGADDAVLVLSGDGERLRGFVRDAFAENTLASRRTPLRQEVGLPARSLSLKMRDHLTVVVAKTLELAAADIDPSEELSDYGFDSITFTELTDQLNRAFGLALIPTVFFEYPTIEKVADFLVEEEPDALARVLGRPTGPTAPAQPQRPVPAVSQASAAQRAPAERRQQEGAVAIIGMSGRFPGARDLDAFWDLLVNGRDAITTVPPERWDWTAIWGDPAEPGRTRVNRAGFMDAIDRFDPLRFQITPREAASMDPQQRLLLLHGFAAIEDAGYAPSGLAGSDTAVFVGTAPSGYVARMMAGGQAVDGFVSTGSSSSIGPNRLSFLLDLHGPSEPVETACSSALVAIHRAVATIRSGRSAMAIAGGVNTILLPDVHVSYDQAGMLSPDGRSKTFSANADGYGRGEGVGILFLKGLDAAERDGDPIHAVIRGSAENHGGRASSLTAPNPRAQARVVEAAVRDSGIDPGTLSYIEAHGTGTELGDPIELEGLSMAFEKLGATKPDRRCALGSVKPNIGHLELAAGVAGLMKVVLQMEHKTLVPTINAEPVNPYLKIEASPFALVNEVRPWESTGVPRRAGVSSFGFGGVNAHIVLEEYPDPVPAERSEPQEPVLLILSAMTGEGLCAVAKGLSRALSPDHAPPLADIAYTLQVGRQALPERAAFVAQTPSAAAALLDRLAAGEVPQGVHRSRARHDAAAVRLVEEDADYAALVGRWTETANLARLAELWVEGVALNWHAMHGAARQRVRLPTYPYAEERCWYDLGATASPAPAPAPASAPAPPPDEPPKPSDEDVHEGLLDRLISGDIAVSDALAILASGAPR